MRWTRKELEEYVQKNPTRGNQALLPLADVEPLTVGRQVEAKADTRLAESGRVVIHFRSLRKKLADPDGISGKAVLDGIVKRGILPDDSWRVIASVSHSQVKTKDKEITYVFIYREE